MKKYRINSDYFILFTLFLFVLVNWFFLSGISSLAPPDYYKYFRFSEKLFSADFTKFSVPPLFPFLLGSIGNILLLFKSSIDAFILGGKIISLLASMGIIYFVFKFFQKFIGEYSAVATFSLVLFPFFMKFSSLPITDIFYLFFVIASFYYFFENKIYRSTFAVILAVLTRYEGILLLFSMTINFLKVKMKNLKVLIFTILALLTTITFYLISSNRIIKKIEFIIAKKSYLFFLINPVKLATLFYLNILFFIPDKTPASIKVTLFFILLGFLVNGYKYLFKLNKRFMFSLLFYQVFFIISKGYIAGAGNVFNPGNQARRMLSVIFIFWFVSVIGFVKFIKWVRAKFSGRFLFILKFLSFFIALVLVMNNVILIKKLPYILTTLFFLTIIFLLLKYNLKKNFIFITTVIFLFLSMYSVGYNDSEKFVKSLPNKGAYMIATWANSNLERGDKLLSYSSNQTVRYYLKNKIILLRIFIKDKKIYRNYKVLRKKLWEKLKKKGIKYLVYDLYLNAVDYPFEVAIKRMFYRYRRQTDYFKLKKRLYYKGKIVATIMEVNK
ncbi:MAG: hypothetical protein ABFR75_12600 [Acidobacteriota bacterium]